jgi:hypothetical protein
MLDRALAKTFANFSTLLLIACLYTVPIHVGHAFVFQDELAVRELSSDIADFPEGRQVRGVASADLDSERDWLLIVCAVELALLVVAYRAAKRVHVVAEEGGVPGVFDAYRHVASVPRGGTIRSGPVIVALLIGLVAGWLVLRIGELLADMTSADTAWAGLGVARALATATATALIAGTSAALAGSPAPRTVPPEELDVY